MHPTREAALRDRLGPTGVWSFRFDTLTPDEASQAAQEVERLGFPALWIPEVGRTEALTLAGHLLSSTWALTVANGIARVSDRSASAAAAGHRYLQLASGGRHVLGIGLGGALSNGPDPIGVMNGYLDEVEAALARLDSAGPHRPTLAAAAYNQAMVTLAAERTGCVHTYLVTPEHTSDARSLIGPDPVIAAEMACVMTDDPVEARGVGRAHVATYIGSRSHQRKFRALGFDDGDFVDGGSDRLVDALVVHGADGIRSRVHDHRSAGADHIAVQVLGTSTLDEDLSSWATLATLVL